MKKDIKNKDDNKKKLGKNGFKIKFKIQYLSILSNSFSISFAKKNSILVFIKPMLNNIERDL